MSLPVRREQSWPLWSPFHQLDDLYEQMNRLFPGFADDQQAGRRWMPLADVEETEEGYLIEVDLPGVRKDEVDVEVHDGQLAVHGEIKEKERTGILRRQTRRVGRFDYRMSLPAGIDADKVSAQLSDGVLTVHLPKVEKAKPRRVEITG